MASELIGRTACPECSFHAAHVKIKTDKEGAFPYRHCPECSAQYFTRNKQQADQLRAKIRAGTETAAPAVKPPGDGKDVPAKPPGDETPAPKKKGLFEQLSEALDD